MAEFRKMLRAKIHRATVTHANVDYEGSVTVPIPLMQEAGLIEYEAVNVWNVTRGTRFETYAIKGAPGSYDISVNGAAAHLVKVGDLIIIATFGFFNGDSVGQHVPKAIFVDGNNRLKEVRKEVAGPKLQPSQIPSAF